ncbi:hypothetical protein [Novosphingobium sp. KA1]|uniref:hypothetical protein n=1 Tax=Novosphingobium sp. (strain KA1) TaxID=164608 RepID=UPI001A90C92E|nr:hypothetical protein [Novosphingobium sp. KA1]QSR15992.1 hypothetical protein CA833_02070 [Novosphingobium sp. KA1]
MPLRAGMAGVIGILGLPALLLAGEAAARELAPAASPAAVIDDPALPHVLATTHKAGKRGHGRAAAGSVEIGPAHLRAHVDRESGAVRWQLWQEVTHAGLARDMTGLALGIDGDAARTSAALPLAQVERQAERCPTQDALVTACTTRVHYAFDVPAGTVARMAASPSPTRLALHDTIGRTFQASMHPDEAAGISDAVAALQPPQGTD